MDNNIKYDLTCIDIYMRLTTLTCMDNNMILTALNCIDSGIITYNFDLDSEKSLTALT